MANTQVKKRIKVTRRQARTRSKIVGTTSRPRLSINRSLKFVAAQVIDDTIGKTILGLHEKQLKLKGKKSERAKEFGAQLAQKMLEKNINTVVFDRGAYSYHGRVKEVAEGLRAGGIKF